MAASMFTVSVSDYGNGDVERLMIVGLVIDKLFDGGHNGCGRHRATS